MKNVVRLVFVLAVGFSSSVIRAQDIASVYVANCANCHGADGRGNTVLGRTFKLRDLRSPEVQKLSDSQLVLILRKGANGGKMPGFEKKLGEETVRTLATYVREIDRQPVPQLKKARAESSSGPADVKTVYTTKCAQCHGGDGVGTTYLGLRLHVPDLGSAEVQKFSDEDLMASIEYGDGPLMPAYRKLGPEMIEKLASYVRELGGRPPIQLKNINANTQSKLPGSVPIGRTELQTDTRDDAKTLRLAKLRSAAINANSKVIDLNSASNEQLMALPGITEADSDNIIAHRPYKSILQVKIKGIISAEQYARIAERLVAKQSTRTVRHAAGEPAN